MKDRDLYIGCSEDETYRKVRIQNLSRPELTEYFTFTADCVAFSCSLRNEKQTTTWWTAFTPDSAVFFKYDLNPRNNTFLQQCHMWHMNAEKNPVSYFYRKDYGYDSDAAMTPRIKEKTIIVPLSFKAEEKKIGKPMASKKIENRYLATEHFENFELEALPVIGQHMDLEKIIAFPFTQKKYIEWLEEYSYAATIEQEKFIRFMHSNEEMTIASAFKHYMDLGAQQCLGLKQT